ncbi:alkaline phosphatase family protein, partial [Actimicrobium sp. CCI2.3]
IITSDHGMIDIPNEKQLTLNSFPKLKSLLSRPTSGEPRVIYCSVKKENRDKFIYEFNQELEKYAYLSKSIELVEQGWFGYYPHKFLISKEDAICDFTIIMKENYALTDNIDGEINNKFIGMHGGISEDEIMIPLAVIP